ncbi:hypothetical protein GCM10010381_65010 [Streptomyces xantholiticus]|nr:hypothetical protein GCM10010381_65010 [Streptomyces xantholiticus]
MVMGIASPVSRGPIECVITWEMENGHPIAACRTNLLMPRDTAGPAPQGPVKGGQVVDLMAHPQRTRCHVQRARNGAARRQVMTTQ